MADQKQPDKTEIYTGAGPKLGRYRLEKKIGQGGMADIFLARAEGPGGFEKQVVIKKIRAQLGRNSKFVEMFLREARLQATLDHPNIVRIFELGEEGGEYYLVLEYLEGLPFRDVVERFWYARRSLPLETLLRCIADTARGLEHAHNFKDARGHPANLVHRDVSPDNVFVTTSGATKLLDFGIAKREGIDMLTQAGEIKGKIPFMSPEALQGYPLDRRCDIWSLGIIMYWMCAGRRPFDGASDLNTMKAILEDEPPQLRELNPLIPPALEALVMSCLTKEREKRMKSAGALCDAIEGLIRGVSGAPLPQALVIEAQRLPGVEVEVRPKNPAAVPVAEWGGRDKLHEAPTQGRTELTKAEPLRSDVARPSPRSDSVRRDAPKRAVPLPDLPSDAERSSSRLRRKETPSPRMVPPPSVDPAPSSNPQVTEFMDASTVAEMRRLAELKKKPSTPMPSLARPLAPRGGVSMNSSPSWEGDAVESDPGGNTHEQPVVRVLDSSSDLGTPISVPHTRGESITDEEQPAPGRFAPLFQIPEHTDPLAQAHAMPLSSGKTSGWAVGLGVVAALGLVGAVGVAFGVDDKLRALLARPEPEAIVDAGVQDVVADAGVQAAVVVDAGVAVPGAGADAGAGDAPASGGPDAGFAIIRASRSLFLVAPSTIEWRTTSGEALLRGAGRIDVKPDEEEVLAVNTDRACTTRVPVLNKRKVEYGSLPRGRITVKAKKGTELFLGTDSIGVAPMRGTLELVAGSCDLRARFKGNEQRIPVEIKPGRINTITVK